MRERKSAVLVTGLGAVSPLGVGAEALWTRLLAGGPPPLAAPPTRPDLSLPPAHAFAEEFPAEQYADRRRVRKASNATRLAVVAARFAVEDARLPTGPPAGDETTVVLGTCFGSNAYYLKFHERVLQRGAAGANAVLFTESVFNAPAGHVSMDHGLRGASLAVAGGEESGLSAVIAAHDRLRLGAARAALAGGVEEYSDLVQASLLSEGRLCGAAPGLNDEAGPIAEGAAVLVLETEEVARARGGAAYAAVLGVARARPRSPGDGAARSDAIRRAVTSACRQAGVAPVEVDLVLAGGAGGARSRAELAGLRAVWPAPDRPRWLCAPQAQWGEGFAFTSAALVAVGVRAVAAGVIPPGCPGGAPRPTDWPAGLAAADEALDSAAVDPPETCLVLATSEPGAVAAVLLGRAPQDVSRG